MIGESGRDAAEKRARMGGLSNSGSSKGDWAGLVRGKMGSKQGSTRRGIRVRGLEDRGSESAKPFPEKKSPRRVGTRGKPLAHSMGDGEGRAVPSATSYEKSRQ